MAFYLISLFALRVFLSNILNQIKWRGDLCALVWAYTKLNLYIFIFQLKYHKLQNVFPLKELGTHTMAFNRCHHIFTGEGTLLNSTYPQKPYQWNRPCTPFCVVCFMVPQSSLVTTCPTIVSQQHECGKIKLDCCADFTGPFHVTSENTGNKSVNSWMEMSSVLNMLHPRIMC